MTDQHWVTVLGATGSIGSSTLDVISQHPQRYQVYALTAFSQVDKMFELCQRFAPKYAVMGSQEAADQLLARLQAAGLDVQVSFGVEALCKVAAADEVTSVMAAIVGAAGLEPTLAAARCGKRVLLANKEVLVMAGQFFMQAVKDNGATLLPIDSEHNAIFQCMPQSGEHSFERAGIRRILLTASGGPFRNTDLDALKQVTPDQACAHPNWSMGRKISVDSASMMNKGLELIEACWLFDTTPDKVDVVVHPQSVIHSMVDYIDGSVIAQLGNPDMRTPIAYGLAWPERISSGVSALDLIATGRLDFQAPDEIRFPCLRLAREAFNAGGTAMAILNAANEVAVDAFLKEQLSFTDIARVIESTIENSTIIEPSDLAEVIEADQQARLLCRSIIEQTAA
jgi:1-deoxy-D-xylulose-5-phosphate reductoisomerase